jgi:surfeit locus 1 family protein
MAGWRFRAPWWAWLLTALLCIALARLGFWQLHRAQEKKAMLAAHASAATADPVRLQVDDATQYRRRVWIEGHFDAEHTLLLDNQVSRGQPGYHVWSPVRPLGGVTIVLVDRGWIPRPPTGLPERIEVPPAMGATGVWYPLPRPGLRLGENDCDRERWPHVVQYPTATELKCLLGRPVADGVLRLDPAIPGGFRREWMEGVIPPARHYGYALTWFSLAATLGVIFLVVNIRRPST